MEALKAKVRTIPDFPKAGIQFRDITTLLSDPTGLQVTLDILERRYRGLQIDLVAGIEARGFVIGAALADRLRKGLLLIRKPQKLPGKTIGVDYELEYGKDRLEMHVDSLARGRKVLLVDDLLATGGTMNAACRLVEKAGGRVVECSFVIELPDLEGKVRLSGYPVFSVMSFAGK